MKRFWDKVAVGESDECWEWTAGRSGGRGREYGYFYIAQPKRQCYAHRLAYALHHGVAERSLNEIRHTCDNPLCCNPNHLRNGTHSDNIRDMWAKERQGQHGKLTLKQAIEIKLRLKDGENGAELGREFKVTDSTISLIRLGKSWKSAELRLYRQIPKDEVFLNTMIQVLLTQTVGPIDTCSLERLTIPQLAALYYELTGRKVTRFKTKNEAICTVRPAVVKKILESKSRFSRGETPRHRKRKKYNLPAGNVLRNFRKGSQRAKIIDMLLEGATFEEIQATFNLSYKNAYQNIRLLNTCVGFGLKEDENGVIRIVT